MTERKDQMIEEAADIAESRLKAFQALNLHRLEACAFSPPGETRMREQAAEIPFFRTPLGLRPRTMFRRRRLAADLRESRVHEETEQGAAYVERYIVDRARPSGGEGLQRFVKHREDRA